MKTPTINNKSNLLPKVLFLVQLPPPVHGVSLMNKYFLNSELINQSFSIDVFDLKFAATIKELEKFSLRKVFKASIYGIKLLKKMAFVKYDAIYFTITPTGFGFYRDAFYVFLMKLFNSKIVLHLHGKGIKTNINSLLKKQTYIYVFKNTHVICLSEELAKDIREIFPAKPFIVANGIAIQRDPIFKKNSLNGGVPRILYFSNFIRNKGILVLVDALALLKDRGCDFSVRFVGSPSNVSIEMLENTLKEKGIGKIATVVGPLYDEAKLEEFKNAHIFAFPTCNDAFPLVILEAMQFSLPVISTYEGSIPDVVVDNKTGFLVNKEDVLMLAEKIEILLKDESLRLKMGREGYEKFINNYTFEHFENNMYNSFKKILENR